MKHFFILLSLFTIAFSFAQEKDSTAVFKKRVLESTEVDFISSYYKQDGTHAAVSGGVGTEQLSDFASNIVVAIPMNDDDVLTVDVGLSAYTSASSSNVNPFRSSSTTTSFPAQMSIAVSTPLSHLNICHQSHVSDSLLHSLFL